MYCKGKPKFGGPGKSKQCCEKKKCQLLCGLPKPKKTCSNDRYLPTEMDSELFDLDKESILSDPKKECSSVLTISEFLQADGRKIHPVVGDGNCLFRALAFALLGEEDHHLLNRSSITRLMKTFFRTI